MFDSSSGPSELQVQSVRPHLAASDKLHFRSTRSTDIKPVKYVHVFCQNVHFKLKECCIFSGTAASEHRSVFFLQFPLCLSWQFSTCSRVSDWCLELLFISSSFWCFIAFSQIELVRLLLLFEEPSSTKMRLNTSTRDKAQLPSCQRANYTVCLTVTCRGLCRGSAATHPAMCSREMSGALRLPSIHP